MEMHRNEAKRLEVLHNLNLLDTDSTEAFDRVTRLASRLFGTPIALVSLVDENRQWFKSRVGIEARETPREQAFCDHTIRTDEVMVVEDATKDERFHDNPLVTGDTAIRFYAGAPLVSQDGYGLGSLCVIDTRAREMSLEDQRALQDLSAIVMRQIDLQHDLGHKDPFSGLPNRNQLFEDLQDLVQDATDSAHLLIVIEPLGTARTDEILRSVGAVHGDTLIRETARLVRSIIDPHRTVYHLDALRYVCILAGDDLRSLREKINELVLGFEIPILCDEIPVGADLAIGIARFRPGDVNGPNIVRATVTAAYEARQSGRICSIYNEESDNRQKRAFRLLTDMRAALAADDQLRLVYQPRIDLTSGTCCGAEALIRWKHPVLGNVAPGEFIPLVEQTALLRPLTEWVISRALHQAFAWEKDGLGVRLSINVSARDLEERDFAERLQESIVRNKVSSRLIELEFTESALVRNASALLGQLKVIEEQGVEIAIDDFGTGYSNHAYLQEIPARTVKIDQCLVRNLATSNRDRIIVQSMIETMHRLEYRVVAEGIETKDVYDLLVTWGCDEGQGYWISRPLETGAFRQWLIEEGAFTEALAS